MKTPTTEQLIYTAGFFDGEGCISIAKGSHSQHPTTLRVMLSQRNPEVLQVIQEWFDSGKIIEKQKKGRPTHELQFFGEDAEQFVRLILPYAVVKKEQLEVGLEFRSLRVGRNGTITKKNSARRFFLFTRIRELKRR